MNILLIGGTGIISSEITQTLLSNGNNVYMLNRGRRTTLLDNRATLIKADIRNETEEEIRSKLQKYQFDSIIDFISFHKDQLEKTLNFCKGLYTQFIFISSATVYKSTNCEIHEDFDLENNEWKYAQDKIECEAYLKDYFSDRKQFYTIIRPYVTYGKTRFPYAMLPAEHWSLAYRIKNHLPVILWDGGQAICTLTHSKEFAVAVVGLINNAMAFNEAFHITSNFRYSWQDVLDITANALGENAVVADITIENLVRNLPRYAHEVSGDKGRTMTFSNDKIKKAVPSFQCNIDFATGIRETINYYDENPTQQIVNYGWVGDVDWLISKVCKNRFRKELSVSFHLARKAGWKNFIRYLVHRFSVLRFLARIN